MAKYWQILGLTAAPETREAVDAAFLARFETLKTQKDPAVLSELQRAYGVAVSVVSFETKSPKAEDAFDDSLLDENPTDDDGLTLDDFAPYVVPEAEPETALAPETSVHQIFIDMVKTKPSLITFMETNYGSNWESKIQALEDTKIAQLYKTLTVEDEAGIYDDPTIIQATQQKIDKENREAGFTRAPHDSLSEDNAGWQKIETASSAAGETSGISYAGGEGKYKDTRKSPNLLENIFTGTRAFFTGYLDFEGRMSRGYYLGATVLLWALVFLAFGTEWVYNPEALEDFPEAFYMGMILFFGMAPMFSSTVRRLHDAGHSGWWVYLFIFVFTPVVNFVAFPIWFIFMIWPGTKGPNKYGPDPLEGRR
ncbi:MAG: DUF805 domain-containing protein [Maricaulaceae bacterium]